MHATANPTTSPKPNGEPPRRPVVEIEGVGPLLVFIAALLVVAIGAMGASGPASVLGVLFVAEVWGAALLVVAPLWLAAWGVGSALKLLIQKRIGHEANALAPVTAQLAAGMAALLVAAWLLGHAGLLGTATAWAMCAIPAAFQLAVLVRWYRWRSAQLKRDPHAQPVLIRLPWTLPLLAGPIALLMVAAACPPGTLWAVEAFAYDVTLYHLQAPLEWQQRGAIEGLTHNVYSYLPNLVEVGYLMLGEMRGSVRDAVFAAQVFHATLGLLAAAAVGQLVARLTSAAVGVVAAAAMLSMGWVLVTASLAYSEMGVLAMAAAALLVLFGPGGRLKHGVGVAGTLCGVATLCKLTAGVFIALPLGLIVLLGLNHATRWQPFKQANTSFKLAAVMALVGILVLAPYLARNTAWTGNPVFPVAASALGHGHWTPELAERWDRAHSRSLVETSPLRTLARQWLMNAGYGAIGGYDTPRRAIDVARFDREYGVPVFMIGVAVCLVVAVRTAATRRLALAVCVMLAVQLAGWFALTHMQSRFLVPTVLPLAVIFGLGVGAGGAALQRRGLAWLATGLAAAVLIILQLLQLSMLLDQTRTYPDEQGNRIALAPLQLIGQLPSGSEARAFAATGQTTTVAGHHQLNHLTRPGDKTLIVADGFGLLWLRRGFAYQTPFDVNLLGELMREHNGDPRAVTQALYDRGFTHVWVHWSELDRLMASYGFDPAVTPPSLRGLAGQSDWQPVQQIGRSITLYRLPQKLNTSGNTNPASGGE